MAQVKGKIGHYQSKLKWWSRVAIRNIKRLLREKKELLRKAEDAAIDGKSMNRVIQLKREINDLLSKEEKRGDKDHVPYGCTKVMVIQDSFIVELLINFGIIELKC